VRLLATPRGFDTINTMTNASPTTTQVIS